MKATGCLSALLLAALVQAQTSVDLKTQSRNIDFGAAASTRPAKTGSSLPGICAVGDLFFLSSGTPGDNLYGCTAVNTWTRQSAANGIPSMTGQANKLLSTDGSSATWAAFGGDVSGPASTMTVTRLQGRTVAGTAPADGQALMWSTASSQWQPAPTGVANTTSAVLNFAPIWDGCCSSLTFTLTGALTSDGLAVGWPSTLEAGLVGMMRVSAANTIEVKLCNWSGATVDPASQNFRATLVRGF